jgi:hypothetical protein
MKRQLTAWLLAGALVAGCGRRTVVTTWPDAVIQVVDDDGAPIAGATIAMQSKISNPSPASMDIGGPGSRSLKTDAKGEVVTTKQTAIFDPGFRRPSSMSARRSRNAAAGERRSTQFVA